MLRSGFYTLLEKGSGLVFSLVTAMLLLRGLSKEDFAAWGLFLVITYFLEMGRSGLLQNGLMTFIARHPEEAPVIISTELVLNVIFSGISIFLMWLAAPWLAESFHLPQFLSLLPAYYAANIAMIGLYHSNFVQQSYVEFRGIFWGTFFMRGTLFAWVVGSKVMGWSLDISTLSWVFFAGICLGTLASWWFSRPFLGHSFHFDQRWVGRFFHYGKYVLGTNLSAMLYKNIDKLALGQLAGPAAFAVYDAAGKVTQMVEAPSFSIASAVFPSSARTMQENGTEGIKRLYEQSVGVILAIILPFLLLAVVFARPLMLLFAGDQYADSAGILQVTAFFGLFMPFAVQFGTVLDSTGHPDVNFRYTLFTAVLNLLLSYGLIPTLGLYGAAFAILLGYSVSFVLMQRVLNRRFGIQWWRAFVFVPQAYALGWGLIQRFLGKK